MKKNQSASHEDSMDAIDRAFRSLHMHISNGKFTKQEIGPMVKYFERLLKITKDLQEKFS